MKKLRNVILLIIFNSIIVMLLQSKVYATNIKDIQFDFDSARDIMMQYVTKNNSKTKIINNEKLYSCDISTGTITNEYTFPTATYNMKKDVSQYYSSQSNVCSYIDENSGLLYYGYNVYRNTFSNDEIIKIIVYDLENSKVKNTFKISGYILNSVGADKKGNIYIGTDDRTKDANESRSLIILSSAGKKISEKKLNYPINAFAGFCTDGTFYIIDEYMAYSAYGYENLMGRLIKAKFNNNQITINEKSIMYAKNIYFSDYSNPVEILNDKYLVTFTGDFIPLNKITEDSYSVQLHAKKTLEKGSDYSYVYNSGVNSIIDGDNVYTLYDNDTIYVYSISSGKKLNLYNANKKIFNMKKCGNDIVLIETDGSKFYIEKLNKTKFKSIQTQTYNMNNFSVYKNRKREDIVKKFSKLAPKNMSETLYSKKSSEKNPYKEATLTSNTKKNALNISNYYRWLAGLTGFKSASDEKWTNAGKGAVLLAASEFSHSPSKPKDMSDSFFKSASLGTSKSNLAMNFAENQYKIIHTVRQLINDTGYDIPGHRNTFLTRNGEKIAYGFSSNYVCQTVEYKDEPNPAGTAKLNNNEIAYAWPTPGYFPIEEIVSSAYWTVNINTDKIGYSDIDATVTIKNLDTGKIFKRTSEKDGLKLSSYWGKFICFAPPTDNGNRYKITVDNLSNKDGIPSKLEYTVNFFSYSDGIYTIKGKKYRCNEYGQLTFEGKDISNLKLKVKIENSNIEYTGRKIKPKVTIEGLEKDKDFKVSYLNNKDIGKAEIIIEGIGNYSGKLTKKFNIIPKRVKIKSILLKNNILKLNWKKLSNVSGYQIYMSTSKNGKYKKIKSINNKNVVQLKKKGLKNNNTYYFKIRAYTLTNNKKIYGNFSKIAKIKLK